MLVAAGLLLPVSALLALDPELSGQRFRDVELGAWTFKAMLVVNGLLLLVAGRWSRHHRPWSPPREPAPFRWAERSGLLLCVLLATGLVLRLVGLGGDLWHDEIFTLLDFVRPALGQIVTDYSDDNQHLLFSVFAHLTTSLLGESSATLRLPAALFGVLSLWASFRLARLLVSDAEALVLTALLTFSYHHIWFSQNARGYTGLLLATVLSTELLLRCLWQGGRRDQIAYALAVAFGMGIHLTMVFVVIAHFLLILVLIARGSLRGWQRLRPLYPLVIATTFTLQLYALVVAQTLRFYLQPSAGVTTADVEWKSPIWMINETLRGLDLGLAFGWIGVLAALLVLGAGLVSLARRAPLATAAFVAPGLFGAAAMLLLGRNLWPRFFFNQGTFAAMFAVRGAWLLGESVGAPLIERLGAQRLSRHLGSIAAALLVVASMLTLPRLYRLPKQDFTGAHRWVQEQRLDGDQVVAVGLAGDAYGKFYAPGIATAQTLSELLQHERGHRRVWLLYTFGSYIEGTEPDLWDHMQGSYEEVEAFFGTLGGGAIVVRRADADVLGQR